MQKGIIPHNKVIKLYHFSRAAVKNFFVVFSSTKRCFFAKGKEDGKKMNELCPAAYSAVTIDFCMVALAAKKKRTAAQQHSNPFVFGMGIGDGRKSLIF